MREDMIFIPADVSGYETYTLSRNIPAIRLERHTEPSHGKAKLGSILHLGVGSQVQVCGEGFNPRTVKVCHDGSYYFVFQEDLAGWVCAGLVFLHPAWIQEGVSHWPQHWLQNHIPPNYERMGREWVDFREQGFPFLRGLSGENEPAKALVPTEIR